MSRLYTPLERIHSILCWELLSFDNLSANVCPSKMSSLILFFKKILEFQYLKHILQVKNYNKKLQTFNMVKFTYCLKKSN